MTNATYCGDSVVSVPWKLCQTFAVDGEGFSQLVFQGYHVTEKRQNIAIPMLPQNEVDLSRSFCTKNSHELYVLLFLKLTYAARWNGTEK